MRHLSTLTNIIPIIAKSDTLSHTQTLQLKISLLRDLKANSIPIFTFGKTYSELERNVVHGIPWAVSCLRDDTAEMDASLLMRDDPVDAYLESDLPHVISAITTNAAWLRYSSTKKFLTWRTPTDTALVPASATGINDVTTLTDGFEMARVGDHIDREERLARVRLVQWATEMRRSVRSKMAEERHQFEAIESQERVKWLVARLHEAVAQETALVPAAVTHRRTGRGKRVAVGRDPLGLVWVKERWGHRVQRGIVWIVEAGVLVGSGWVVWKYVVDPGLSGWFVSNARAA
jgi:Septin